MAKKTQGTSVYFRKLVGAAYSIVHVGEVTAVDGTGGARDQIDVTNLESPEREFLGGFANPAAASLPVNWDPTNDTHTDLETLFNSGDKVTWIIGLSDGASTIEPSADPTTGVITYPTTRSFISFDGYVADFPINAALNDAYRAPMTVQRSGARTITRKTP